MKRRDFRRTAAASAAITTVFAGPSAPVPAAPKNPGAVLPELGVPLHPINFLRKVVQLAHTKPDGYLMYAYANQTETNCGSAYGRDVTAEICARRSTLTARKLISPALEQTPGTEQALRDAELEVLARKVGFPECLRDASAKELPAGVQLHHFTVGRNVHAFSTPGELNVYWLTGEPYAVMHYRLPDGSCFTFRYGRRLQAQPGSAGLIPEGWEHCDCVELDGSLVTENLPGGGTGAAIVGTMVDKSYEPVAFTATVLHNGRDQADHIL